MRERVGIALRLAARALCVMLVLACARAALAEPAQTIVDNGDPANRVDIAILGDGYTSGEMSKYASDVQQFVQGVFQQDPWREYQRFFNVHRIDVASAESGVDHPEASVFRNTAFDAAYNCSGIQRLICASVGKVMNVASASLPPAQRDLVILIVNDTQYGGSGGAVAIASTHPEAVELILHESGHTFGLLADEYDSSPPTCVNNVEPPEPNVTKATDRASAKWNAWIDPSTPVPTQTTTPALPGLYLGAKYCTSGLFRPTFNSKMRNLGQPYDQINTEQMVRRIYNTVSPIDSAAPAASTVSLTTAQSQTFSVSTPAPMTHALDVSWSVDGQPAGASQPSLTVAPGALGVGAHTVEATVTDRTAMVRTDPEHLLTDTVRWSVTVASSNQIDDTSFFVTQHYRDFLSREPDASGLQFWTNEIEQCGADAQCREVKRINVSAAFFLSIEFQQTGYLVERMYKAAYGDAAGFTHISGSPVQIPVPVIRRSEFLADAAVIRNGLVVGAPGWEQLLENNKNAFSLAFVRRQRFTDAYPTALAPAQFVARLNQNTGGALTQVESDALAAQFGGAADTSDVSKRASVFRALAENSEFDRREKNRAFVLMQFFGYLQRDPDATPDTDHTGWQFWLDKLNQFNGNFVQAEMVKAFISSGEYRHRFGQ